MSRKTEEISPLNPGQIKMYTCGLTVYSQPHIGNWIGYIYWDVLVRVLRSEGYQVKHVQNYTDVGHLVSDDDSGEDKMEKGAKAEGLSAWEVADKYIQIAEHEGYELLKLNRPNHVERATEYIDQQIGFVKQLEQKGFTYIVDGEGVYFDTSRLPDYGKLARLDIQGLEAGARVSVRGKRNITDFALWKFSPIGSKRDMEWDSPWGKGFPGWHLECSTIARETLGDQIDIHGGGIDHIPVHHTNEIAQTESLTGKTFSKFWVHNNHLKINGQKISKSLGNIITVSDILDKGFDLRAFRLFVLGKHYRNEGNFTWENIEAAQNRLETFQAMADLRFQPNKNSALRSLDFDSYAKMISSHLKEDLNTSQALNVLSEVCDILHEPLNPEYIDSFYSFLEAIDELTGLGLLSSKDITQKQKDILSSRELARESKDWEKSDQLRQMLEGQGIGVRDTQAGPIWYRLK
jgi:cysteinyl-tRNA synthetase